MQTFFGLRHALLLRSWGRNTLLPRSWGRNAWRSPENVFAGGYTKGDTSLFDVCCSLQRLRLGVKELICGKSIRKVKVKPKDFSGCQLSSTRREPNEGMCHPKSNRGVSKVVLANDTRKILSNISASLHENFSPSDFAIRKNRYSSSFVAGQSIFFVCVLICFFDVFSGKLHSITPHTLYFFSCLPLKLYF